MINFFRKTRKELATEKKTVKYLRYAIGEIFLVVIGILIALQVNNWNQDRMDRFREKEILAGLYHEFIAAKTELEADLRARNRYLQSAEWLQQQHLSKSEIRISKDSISSLFRNLFSSRFYSVPHPILDDLGTTGGLEIIQSDTIRIMLDNYLQEEKRYMTVEEIEGDFVRNQLIPFFSNYFDASYIFKEKMSPEELQEAIENIPEKNKYGTLLDLRITRTNVSLNYGKRLESFIDQLIKELRNESKFE